MESSNKTNYITSDGDLNFETITESCDPLNHMNSVVGMTVDVVILIRWRRNVPMVGGLYGVRYRFS